RQRTLVLAKKCLAVDEVCGRQLRLERARRCNEQRRERKDNERAGTDVYQMILNPICICLGSRVRVPWPNVVGIVALVIVVAVAALPVFSVTADGLITLLKPAFAPLRKFARLKRLKMSHRN